MTKSSSFETSTPRPRPTCSIIPVKHLTSIAGFGPEDDALMGRLLRVAAQLAEAEGIAAGGYRLVTNTGREAGQSVDHLHFHLLGGRRLSWPPG